MRVGRRGGDACTVPPTERTAYLLRVVGSFTNPSILCFPASVRHNQATGKLVLGTALEAVEGVFAMPTSGEEPPSLLDPETLQGLLRHLESTDVDELEVVHGAARVYLRREPGHRTAYVQGERPGGSIPESAFAITAPLTGIYYGRPSPDQPVFISEGEAVEPGQVVALIETMKLFNEVTAELFGTVIRIAVTEHDPVELGQTLMYVQPADPKDLE